MKPISSAIITTPRGQHSKAGMQHGEHGLATHASSQQIASSEAEVECALERLTHLLHSRSGSQQEVNALADALSQPAPKNWLLARIAALLSPYYEKDVPQGVKMIEAEDWLDAIEGYPQWAVTKAVRWWKSAENDKRRVRPLEGDIVARIKVEMDAIRAAKYKPTATHQPSQQPKQSNRISADRAAQIMAEVGFNAKRFK